MINSYNFKPTFLNKLEKSLTYKDYVENAKKREEKPVSKQCWGCRKVIKVKLDEFPLCKSCTKEQRNGKMKISDVHTQGKDLYGRL